MKTFTALLTFSLIFSLSGLVYADNSISLTRSSGKLLNDNSQVLTEKLATSPIVESTVVKQRLPQIKLEASPTQQFRQASHVSFTEFEIYDAWVELTGDIDNDGFYHRIRTTFDADVNTPVETVYAKLYVSYEGGPWQQFADTDLFEIYFDASDDTYEVVTELIEGYRPGYYDVLIELYSFYHDGIVADAIITHDIDGYAITLEDLEHDDFYHSDSGDDYYVAAGSFSWLGLFMLALLVTIKFRYFAEYKKEHVKTRLSRRF